ncbi:MAG: hypothetical protein AAFS10_09610 [Myxococcota bacterium]
MIRLTTAVAIVLFALTLATACETKTEQPQPKADPSETVSPEPTLVDNPKSRAGKMLKKAKDARIKLKAREDALDQELDRAMDPKAE